MRRFVAFPGIAVLLLVVGLVIGPAFATSGWSVAPNPGGSAVALSVDEANPAASPVSAPLSAPALAESGAWLGATSLRTLGVRGTAGHRPSTDSSRDHVASRLGMARGLARSANGSLSPPAPGAGLARRTPLPPFVTTLPPPGDVRI